MNIEDRVAALEEQQKATEAAFEILALGMAAAFEKVGEKLKEFDTRVSGLAVATGRGFASADEWMNEVGARVSGLEEQIESVSDAADDSDDDVEAMRVEIEDALIALREDVNTVANGVMGYILHSDPDFRDQFLASLGMDEAGDLEIGVDEGGEDSVAAVEFVADEDGIVMMHVAEDPDDLTDIVADLREDGAEPVASIIRLEPSDYDEPFDAEDVPQYLLDSAGESVPDCFGVIALEFIDDAQSREELVSVAYTLIDDCEAAGCYDIDLLNTLRHAFNVTGPDSFSAAAQALAPPGFISSALFMFAQADEDNTGVYLVPMTSTEDVVETLVSMFFINCAKSDIEP